MTKPKVFAVYDYDHEVISYHWSEDDANFTHNTLSGNTYVSEIDIEGPYQDTNNRNIVFILSVVRNGQWLGVNSSEELARNYAEVQYGVDTSSWKRYDFARKSLYGVDRDNDLVVIDEVELD